MPDCSIKVQLLGSCVSCASSEITLKMGVERRLLSRLQGLQSVEQVMPIPPISSVENIEAFLNEEIRPLLDVGEASVLVVSVDPVSSTDLRPLVTLKLVNLGFSVDSIKEEIVERLIGHFLGTIRVRWDRNGL